MLNSCLGLGLLLSPAALTDRQVVDGRCVDEHKYIDESIYCRPRLTWPYVHMHMSTLAVQLRHNLVFVQTAQSAKESLNKLEICSLNVAVAQ